MLCRSRWVCHESTLIPRWISRGGMYWPVRAKYSTLMCQHPCSSAILYRYLNVIQSHLFEELYHTGNAAVFRNGGKLTFDSWFTDNNVVVSSPTGSGKTVLFELAILRMLTQNKTS